MGLDEMGLDEMGINQYNNMVELPTPVSPTSAQKVAFRLLI